MSFYILYFPYEPFFGVCNAMPTRDGGRASPHFPIVYLHCLVSLLARVIYAHRPFGYVQSVVPVLISLISDRALWAISLS